MQFRQVVMSISAKERNRRRCEADSKERERMKQMSEDELISCYVRLKTEYEQKKRFFSLILVVLFVAFACAVWHAFALLLPVQTFAEYAPEDAETLVITFFVVCLLASSIFLSVVLIYLRGMRQTHRALLLAENVKGIRE